MNKKQARIVLIRKLKVKIDEQYNNMIRIASGEFDKKIEISKNKDGKKWYINIPSVVYDFVEIQG